MAKTGPNPPDDDSRYAPIDAAWRQAHADNTSPPLSTDFDDAVMAAVRRQGRPMPSLPVLQVVWRFAAAACLVAGMAVAGLSAANGFDVESMSAVLAWDFTSTIYGGLIAVL